MQRHGRTDFHLMGYDLLRRNVACLKEGVIDFIIAQQPTVQGYNSIECLCNHLILRKKVKDCNYMPINLITTETSISTSMHMSTNNLITLLLI